MFYWKPFVWSSHTKKHPEFSLQDSELPMSKSEAEPLVPIVSWAHLPLSSRLNTPCCAYHDGPLWELHPFMNLPQAIPTPQHQESTENPHVPVLHLGPMHLSDLFMIMLRVRWVVVSLGAPTIGSVLCLDPPKFLPGTYSVRLEPILPQKSGPSIYWFCVSFNISWM